MNWFCIHTKPFKEEKSTRYLRDVLGLEVYFPRLRRHTRVERRERTVESALFPRYLFCRMDLGLQCRAVRYAPDVIDIVSFGGSAAVVEDSIVDGLRAWTGPALDAATLEPALAVGETVTITSGPLRGLEAVILSDMNDRHRVLVLLSVLSCGARMIVDRDCLKRAS